MNSRERILAAINRQPVDRIATDIWATGEVWAKLRAHFGESADIGRELHIDGFAGVGPEYTGPALPPVAADESINFWGIRTRRIPHEGGAYDEQSGYPLAAAQTIDDLNRYAWPRADWFDYSGMLVGRVSDFFYALAGDGMGYILASCHNLQVNTPAENIIAMYDEAWKYGERL